MSLLQTEIEIYNNKYTKDQLIEQLLFYKHLDRLGNIYYEYKPDKTLTLKEILCRILGMDISEFNNSFNCSFTVDSKHQKRTIKKVNINRHLLTLGRTLAIIYKRDYEGESCPRIKKNKTTEEILLGGGALLNCYPEHYIDNVKKYLKDNPIESWELSSEDILLTKFTPENNRFSCNKCLKNLAKTSRKTHLKSCKGIPL